MRTHLRRRLAAALILFGIILSSAFTTTATAAAAPTLAARAAQGWTYYATYPSHASCAAAGQAAGGTWKCVVSARPGAFDLYVAA